MREAWQPLLEQLVRERYERLLTRAILLVGPGGDPHDLVQEALLATFGGRAHLTSLEAAEQYVRRAIVSRFVDRLRRDAREGAAHENACRLAQPGHVPEVATELEAALALLAPRERACVVLRHVEGLSVAETARQLGLSDRAVKRYTHDGLRTLNEALGTDVNDDDVAVRPVTGHAARSGVRGA